jgi:hypothetical protein
MIIKTYDEGKDEMVTCGEVIGDTYFRDVKMEHFMLKFFGFGVQKEIIDMLENNDIKKIVLNTKKKPFKSTLADWIEHGKIANFGHGDQVFLSTRYMQ